MNQQLSAAQRRRRAERRQDSFKWYLKTAGVMLLAGIVCASVISLAWPVWLKIGFSESTAARLPNFAFFAGLFIGLGARYSKSVKGIVASVLAPFVFGAVLCCVGLLIGALLLVMNVPPSIADWAPQVGFVIGALLGVVLATAAIHDHFQSAFTRIRAKLRTRYPG